MAYNYEEYIRKGRLPHIWCPGCGYGIIMKSMIRAIASMGWSKDETVIASGIGCASRLPGYLDFNTLHTTHGRSLAFATGIKLANPALKIVALGGDGDMSAIGGNHFIHACRRNIDMTVIIFNNNIYGMTGGQYSPTTPAGAKASTAPFGMLEPDFDLCKLAIAEAHLTMHCLWKNFLKKLFRIKVFPLWRLLQAVQQDLAEKITKKHLQVCSCGRKNIQLIKKWLKI